MRTVEEIKKQFHEQKAPFVWQLKLSPDEYEAIKSGLLNNTFDTDYLLQMIFVGEWYKREYDGTNSLRDLMPEIDGRTIWENCGFRNYSQWVYESERGKEWTYSLYVLGGLSAKLETGHPDDRLLEQLCCLYHGEEIELTAKDNRAVGLAKSIENEGSIFYYIQEIISGLIPYSQDDMDDKEGAIHALLRLLKRANKNALSQKFNCEWIINYASYYETMSRKLKLALRPERGAKGRKQYLSYERVEAWGFSNPDTIARIKVSLRFSYDSKIVKEENFEDPLMIYSNSGNDSNGFLAWNAGNHAVTAEVPTMFFNKTDVVVEIQRTDFSTERKDVAANADFPEFIQLFQVAKRNTEWSSRYRQAQSAVLYSDRCSIIEPPNAPKTVKKFFRTGNDDSQPKESEPYNWTPVVDKITIRDSFGFEKTFYNRTGSYVINFKRYENLFHYSSPGVMKYQNRPGNDFDWKEESLPVLFGSEGFEILNYGDSPEMPEKIQPDRISIFRDGVEIKDSAHLTEGVLTIKIHFKGLERRFKVWYIPVADGQEPLIRDFENRRILWFDGRTVEAKDEALTVKTYRGDELNRMEFEIYSPIMGHEIKIDGYTVERIPLNDPIEIPFITAERFSIATIDQTGVREITGRELKDLYYKAPLQSEGTEVLKTPVKVGNITMYLFHPNVTGKFNEVSGYKIPTYEDNLRHYGKIGFPDSNPFFGPEPLPALDSFLLAISQKTYFLIFESLRDAVINETQTADLILPLIQKNLFKEETFSHLWRLAFEFHFDWMLLPRQQWEIIPPEERESVEKFFMSSPKAIVEAEKTRLRDFIDRYWDFKEYTTDKPIAKTALKMILGECKIKDKRAFLKEFDYSPIKFQEMGKVI